MDIGMKGMNGLAATAQLRTLFPAIRTIILSMHSTDDYVQQGLRAGAAGNNTKEIAFQLALSIKTIETHRAKFMDKLAIRDLAGLVRYAIRTGLVALDR